MSQVIRTHILDTTSFPGMVIAVVAVQGDRGDDWAAYIGGFIGGQGSSQSWAEHIARHGTKIDPEVATLIFPSIADEYEWRP